MWWEYTPLYEKAKKTRAHQWRLLNPRTVKMAKYVIIKCWCYGILHFGALDSALEPKANINLIFSAFFRKFLSAVLPSHLSQNLLQYSVFLS